MQRAALSGLRSLNRSGLSMYSSRGHKSVYINNANCILARMYSDDTKKIKITRTKKVNASPEALNEKIESPTLSEVFGSEDSVPNAKESLQPTWSWIPPRHAGGSSAEDDSEHVIPVIRKQLLTLKEISDAMKKLGGTDIKEIKLLRKLDTITHCIIVSGSSRRQLRKMADVLVKALKARELTIAPGCTGAEGADEDDWLLVDCYDCAVHLLTPASRTAIKLEEHLMMEDIPYPINNGSDEDYERQLEELQDRFPVPDDYNVDSVEDVVIKDRTKDQVKLNYPK